jgi:hypothetical protein
LNHIGVLDLAGFCDAQAKLPMDKFHGIDRLVRSSQLLMDGKVGELSPPPMTRLLEFGTSHQAMSSRDGSLMLTPTFQSTQALIDAARSRQSRQLDEGDKSKFFISEQPILSACVAQPSR